MPVITPPSLQWAPSRDLGGQFAPDIHGITAVNAADDRLMLFARDASNTLITRWITRQGNTQGDWNSAWTTVTGATVDSDIAAVRGVDGRVRVFWRTPGNDLQALQEPQINAGLAGAGAPLTLASGITASPCACLGADGRAEVFYRDADGTVGRVAHATTAYGPFGAPASLGGPVNRIESPAAALASDGRIVVLAIGRPGEGVSAVQQETAGDSTAWGDWQLVSENAVHGPAALPDADGRVRVFYHSVTRPTVETAIQGADYDGFEQPEGIGGSVRLWPVPVLSLEGRQQVFFRNIEDETVYGIVQSSHNSDTFLPQEETGWSLWRWTMPRTGRFADNRSFVLRIDAAGTAARECQTFGNPTRG
ncbi:hypothetical protein ACIPX0_27800 [Streptomyces sp. NPDC090075]|uniref:hypothetical protein n=1 Tax=Streptomyces sp. NPDC090075 TaxID=3365937 RepID=UPI00380FC2F3